MKESLRQKLLKKGWTEEEISYTDEVIRSSDMSKSSMLLKFEKVVYWLALMIAIFGNMIISVVLIPFFLLLHAGLLYMIVIMLGAGFGFLYDILIRDIEDLAGREMILENVFLPSLALINVGFMTYFGNILAQAWNLSNVHNPFLVGLIYAISFIGPWLVKSYVLEGRTFSEIAKSNIYK
jgi:hypothetical protein